MDVNKFINESIEKCKGDSKKVMDFYWKYGDLVDGTATMDEFPELTGVKVRTVRRSGYCELCRVPFIVDDYMLVCPSCGVFEERDYAHYPDVFKQRSRTEYKEIGHFKSILSMVRNKENKVIPKHIVEDVQEAWDKAGELNIDLVRALLKQAGHVKHYKHAVQVLSCLQGKPIHDTLTQSEENRILDLFREVSETFQNIEECRSRKTSSTTTS